MSTARRDLEAGLSLALNGGFCNGPRAEKGNFLILDDANDMTIATVHKDGNPQANTVSYVNDGLNIYFGSAANSQKARNLARDSIRNCRDGSRMRSFRLIFGRRNRSPNETSCR